MTNDTPVQAASDTNAAQDSKPASAVVERKLSIALQAGELPAYEMLQTGAVVFELGARHISVFTGEKAVDALNGLVSNDLMPLAVGRGVYAAALTPKGKMLADVSIFRTEPQTFLVESTEHAGREWYAMVKKYVNPRLAKYRDDSAAVASIGVYGPAAPALLARLGVGGMGDESIADAMEQGLRAWSDWANASFVLSGENVRLVRAPHLGSTPGFVILAPMAARADVVKNLKRVGAAVGSDSLWQLASLEGSRPLLGYDMDANTIPQEANLDDWSAISYEKGCYTGQETVARLHFRGHVNKHLRGLRSDTALTPGEPVFDGNGKLVGDVRRSGLSPRLGAIAIAMLRRELPADGTVDIGSASSGTTANVVA
ncbi:MAG: glycine cleavage T C-terminal barrel domain-containing protein, partial [Gemmatimonadaceae bacterium]